MDRVAHAVDNHDLGLLQRRLPHFPRHVAYLPRRLRPVAIERHMQHVALVFGRLKDREVRVETTQEVTLAINTVREVFQSENVNAATSPVDVGQAQNQEHLSGTEVNDMPFANSHSLRNSLPLMPGVITDAAATLHVNGSSENQVLFLLDGFNITNPISGRFQTLLAVEGIRSVDLSSGRYSPEFGKGSAGSLSGFWQLM